MTGFRAGGLKVRHDVRLRNRSGSPRRDEPRCVHSTTLVEKLRAPSQVECANDLRRKNETDARNRKDPYQEDAAKVRGTCRGGAQDGENGDSDCPGFELRRYCVDDGISYLGSLLGHPMS